MLSYEELRDGLQMLKREPGVSKKAGVKRNVCVAS